VNDSVLSIKLSLLPQYPIALFHWLKKKLMPHTT
jgi:hypothetical protein